MKVLILGGTGLLGQALVTEALERGWLPRTAARRGADIALDVGDLEALDLALRAERADLVINCAALVDVAQCEADPGLAYRINGRPVAALADWSGRSGRRLVHISTDHFYPAGGASAHTETEPVFLLNEYARTKYAAEAFALNSSRALVLRTSIIGLRGWSRPTFAEWALQSILGAAPFQIFTDAYTSSIDVGCFARVMYDLAMGPASGLFNLAAGEVYSKADFVRELAGQLGHSIDHAQIASVGIMNPPRPASLGLDVSRAQAHLGIDLPRLEHVAAAIVDSHKGKAQA